MSAQDALRRRALEYHSRPDRGPTCGSMAADMDLLLSGLATVGADARLVLTDDGRAMLAPATEARRAETENTGSVHDGAVPKAGAQT